MMNKDTNQSPKQKWLLRLNEAYEPFGISDSRIHNLFRSTHKEFRKRSLNKKQGDGVIRCTVPLQHKNNKDGNK